MLYDSINKCAKHSQGLSDNNIIIVSILDKVFCPMCEAIHENNTNCQRSD